MAVALIATATSCSNQTDDPGQTPSRTFSVVASADNTSSRTTLAADGTLAWRKGDIMGLYVDRIQNNKAFNYLEERNIFQGSFAYTGQSVDKVTFYAYYPYSGYSSGYKVSASIPSIQQSVFDGSGDFMIATPIEAAYTESEEMRGLNFAFDANSHLFTILHLQLLDGQEGALSNEYVTAVTVTSEGNVLSGDFEVDVRSAENPVMFTAPCDNVKVVFSNRPALSKSQPIDVWLVVNPTKEDSPINLSIKVSTSTGAATFTTAEPIELHRSTIKHLPIVKVADKWAQTASINDAFTDETLLKLLISKCDSNEDGLLTHGEVATLTELSCEGKRINSLAGLELLTNLTTLNCANNNLTEVLGSQIPNVTSLNISNNALIKADLSQCTKLKSLNANGLTIEDIDISACKALTEVFFEGATVDNLKMNGLSSVTTASIRGNIKNLNMSGCKQLQSLDVINIGLHSLDVSNCTSMAQLNCYDNANLKTLNVKGCSSLQGIMCRSCAFTSLDLSGLATLGTIYCQRNPLKSVTLTGCIALHDFYAHTGQWVNLDLSMCPSINSINLKDTPTLKSVTIPAGKPASIVNVTNSGTPQILYK